MRYLVGMTLSGSMMLLLYLLVRQVMGIRLSNGWRYCILKCAMLYYLIPLPFLKPVYKGWLGALFPESSEMVYTWKKSDAIVKVNDKWLISSVLQKKMLFIGVWLGIAIMVLVLLGMKYMQNKKRILVYRQRWKNNTDIPMFGGLKRKHGIRRRVSCYTCEMKQEAFTMGIFHPVIMCRGGTGDELSEYIISHELVHIKHVDVLWRMLMSLVKIIHWYNPAVWWLGRELEQVSEMYCDDTVLQGKDTKERIEYAKLLCEEAISVKQTGIWKVAMSGNAKMIKERMENAMKKENGAKKWSNWLVGCMVTVLVMVNSLTVFAYEDVYYKELEGEPAVVEQKAEELLKTDSIFIPDGVEGPSIYDNVVVLYEHQFTDEEGNIYPIEENSSIRATCEHTYVYGTIQDHIACDDGGCKVIKYSGKRCTKCGDVVRVEYISTISYEICEH